MKLVLTLSTFLMIAMLATSTHARSFHIPKTSHKVEGTCDEASLYQLAACGCYVQATIPEPPKEEIYLCHQQYGDDLVSLKPNCQNFLDGDEVDVDAFTDAIIEVQNVCLPQLVGSSRIAAASEVDMEHTERILPYVVLAIIAFYPQRAY